MLKSPSEDFARSLEALPNALEKLNYVAGLRQPDGDYFHWGLSRSHGEQTAKVAIAQAHTDVFSQVLRTSLATLWNETKDRLPKGETDEDTLLRRLEGQNEALIPSDVKGGSPRHLKSVLLALSHLAASAGQKTRRGA